MFVPIIRKVSQDEFEQAFMLGGYLSKRDHLKTRKGFLLKRRRLLKTSRQISSLLKKLDMPNDTMEMDSLLKCDLSCGYIVESSYYAHSIIRELMYHHNSYSQKKWQHKLFYAFKDNPAYAGAFVSNIEDMYKRHHTSTMEMMSEAYYDTYKEKLK